MMKLELLAVLTRVTLGGTDTLSVSLALTLPAPSAPVLVFNTPAGGCALALLTTVVCANAALAGSNKAKTKAAKPRFLEGWRCAKSCDIRGMFINDLCRWRMCCAVFGAHGHTRMDTSLAPSLRQRPCFLCGFFHATSSNGRIKHYFCRVKQQ